MARLKTLPARLASVGARVATLQAGSWRAGTASSSARGYGYKWQQARAGYLDRHPLCVACELVGQVTAATDVDHVIPHRGDMVLFWNRDNWQALCGPCHKAKTARGE